MSRDPWTWQQFATAALGITSMIAGGFMMHTPAGAPLIAAGGTLVGIAIPWPKRREHNERSGD